MRKITKKTIKRIKAGHHDDLMEAIELLIDSYRENKVDLGYRMALDDMSVRSYRLAEHILDSTTLGGLKALNDAFEPDALDKLAKVIDDYFYNALNNKT